MRDCGTHQVTDTDKVIQLNIYIYCKILYLEHLFSVQMQLVAFRDLSNSMRLSEFVWHLRFLRIRHNGLHFVYAVPLIWWYWHLSIQLQVMFDWLVENIWLSYWHKRAKQNCQSNLNQEGKLKTKPNYLKDILTKECWHRDIFYIYRWLYLKTSFKFICAVFNRYQYYS